MKRHFPRFFFRSPSKYWFWLLLAFFVKGVIPFVTLFFAHRQDPHLLSMGFIGDAPSYVDPINNFLATGHYMPDHRMPGYGIVYLLFRSVFSYNTTYNCIVIIQLFLSAASVYLMALIARVLLKSRRAFYLTFYLYLICTYSNYYDICLGTECMCTAFLLFSTWLFLLYMRFRQNSYLFFSGLFLTWTVFLRPAFAPTFFIFGLILLIYFIKNKIKWFKPAFIFLSAFILIDGAWVIRNQAVHHRIIPLTVDGVYYPYIDSSYMRPMFEFVETWGGASDIPDPGSAMSWFGGVLFPGEPTPKQYDSIPDYIYNSTFNKDSLVKLRQMQHAFMAMQKPAADSIYEKYHHDWNYVYSVLYTKLKPVSPQADALQKDIINRYNKYTTSIKKGNPFLYYVKTPILLLGKSLYQPGLASIFVKGSRIPKIGKGIVTFNKYLYIFLLIVGLSGLILLLYKGLRKDYMLLILTLPPAYAMLIHTIVLRMADNRYLMPTWPFVIACAAYMIIAIYERIKSFR